MTLSGCHEEETNEQESEPIVQSAVEGDAFASEYEISYDTKEYTPNVIIDQAGYEIEGIKTVLFRGDELSDTFQVYEYVTGNLVYEGDLVHTSNAELSIGYFTELRQEGIYYVQTDRIGQSYPFSIKKSKDIQVLYQSVVENFIKQDTRRYFNSENLEELFPVLLALEMYPGGFFDGDLFSTQNNIPDILDYMLEVADEIMKYDIYPEEINESNKTNTKLDITAVDEMRQAAFFGKLADTVNRYDSSQTSTYTKFAEQKYTYAVELMKKEAEDSASGKVSVITSEIAYFASSELYKLTGRYTYRKSAETYAVESGGTHIEDRDMFYGNTAYMSIRRSVNVDFCIDQMALMRKEVIAWEDDYRTSYYMVRESEAEDFLFQCIELLWIHELNYSQEYEELLDEIFSYFTGINMDGLSYSEEIGYTVSKESFENNVLLNNQYLLILGRKMQAMLEE